MANVSSDHTIYIGQDNLTVGSSAVLTIDTGRRICVFCGTVNDNYQDICSSCMKCDSCKSAFTLSRVDDKIAEVRCLSCLHYRNANMKLQKYKKISKESREKTNVKQI